jgi:septal ring factor EnvC (AmiA/AmiB activator)
VSSVPRHSEEELRQQWAFLDALVDRQASSLKSGVQDPEEEDFPVAAGSADVLYRDEISALTHRVTTLEGERTALLRRIDLAEEARVAAETARAAAEAARAAAERALAGARTHTELEPGPPPVETPPIAATESAGRSPVTAPTPRRRSWWQRFRE